MTDARFLHDRYTIRRKVFTILGAKFHVFDEAGSVVFFTKQKAFKLREDIRLFSDETMSEEILTMKARQIIDFGVTFDIVDTRENEVVGSLRRKGMKSIIRDEWLVFDASGVEVGAIREDDAGLAVIRRFIEAASFLMPQKFHVEIEGRTVATFAANRNPFVQKIAIEFMDAGGGIDRRLGLAAGILICAVEGRQG